MINNLDFTVLTNPFGHHENVRKAMEDSLKTVGSYPDKAYKQLNSFLSGYIDLDESNIVITAGTSEGIHLLPQVIKPSQTGIVMPTFTRYRPAAMAANSNIIDILLNRDFSLPMQKILDNLANLDLLYICNPNNPTGNTFGYSELLQIVEEAHNRSCFVVMDEVYLDFSDKPEDLTLINFTEQYSNLAVLRSFSKALAIPGLRAGYAVTNNETAGKMREFMRSWPVNTVGLRAALAGLKENDFLMESFRKTRIARNTLSGELRSLDFLEVFPCNSNMLMVKVREEGRGPGLKEELASKGFKMDSLSRHIMLSDDYFLIGVRQPYENGRLADALKSIGSEERLVA